MPVKCPSPYAFSTYSSSPLADGKRAPNLAKEYPWRAAIPPARRNDTHTAAPATSPAGASSEKMPAPTMAPMPMNAAWRTVSFVDRALSVASMSTPVSSPDACATYLRPIAAESSTWDEASPWPRA